MVNQELAELLKIEAAEISNGFKKASIEGKTTPQEVADRREIIGPIPVTDEGLILRPDNGNGESLVTKDMYVGKEIIAFPYMGGIIKPVLQHGKKMVIIVAIAMIVIGCWGLGKKAGDKISS
ncbi:MAG: hypothetical protein K6G84_12455 [Lachnospiraceae bacterium]|nr:hypothetical protein [Lachnospiraceae bacterium]